MKNKIIDLNNHLFAQLERLNDEELSDEQLEKEIKRSRAITGIATNIVKATATTIDGMKLMERSGYDIRKMGQQMLKGPTENTEK